MQIQLTLNITFYPTTNTTFHSPTIKHLKKKKKKKKKTFSGSPPISFYQEGHNISIDK